MIESQNEESRQKIDRLNAEYQQIFAKFNTQLNQFILNTKENFYTIQKRNEQVQRDLANLAEQTTLSGHTMTQINHKLSDFATKQA